MAKKIPPKTVYVQWSTPDKDENGVQYLTADDTKTEAADRADGCGVVGEYRLVRVKRMSVRLEVDERPV